jgi:hypothetical protein
MSLLCFTIRIVFQLFNITYRIKGLVAARYVKCVVSEYIKSAQCVQTVTSGFVTCLLWCKTMSVTYNLFTDLMKKIEIGIPYRSQWSKKMFSSDFSVMNW